jgi:NAD(P)-dependent dehydrogenase (short-subunit alcohol dehydrogenase family)
MADPKVVLVTGGSSGLGAAVVARLAADGHRVFGTSRRPADGSGLVALDVTSGDSVAACVERVVAEAGRIDVLVSNAGYGIAGAVEDTSLDEARAQLETNFFGAVRVTQAVLPVMRAQGSGRVITVSSFAALQALPYQPFYSASKWALEGLAEALRLELRGSGVDACTVLPGDFRTGFTEQRVLAAGARSPEHADRLAAVLATYERDENAGADPAKVGALVSRLVTARRVRPRYLVGKPSQRLAVNLKRVLPASAFEWAFRKTYRID